MTNLPDDHIDPYESRLTRRVGAFADQAVRPIDASAIASAAAAGARRQTLAGRLFGSTSSTARLGVVLAGTILVVVLGAVLGAGGLKLGPSATDASNNPDATPTSVPGAVDACAPAGLSAEITAWEGAAGHRIATVRLTNTSTEPCTVPRYFRPALVDEDGHALIVTTFVPEPAPLTLPAGATGGTLIDMANYCGNAPTAPLFLRLYLTSDATVEAKPAASVSEPIDAPPCNGPNAPAEIQMQQLELTAAGQ